MNLLSQNICINCCEQQFVLNCCEKEWHQLSLTPIVYTNLVSSCCTLWNFYSFPTKLSYYFKIFMPITLMEVKYLFFKFKGIYLYFVFWEFASVSLFFPSSNWKSFWLIIFMIFDIIIRDSDLMSMLFSIYRDFFFELQFFQTFIKCLNRLFFFSWIENWF